MTAEDLLSELAAAGVTLRADGDHLIAAPSSRLTDAQRQALRTCKRKLIQLLAPIIPTHPPVVAADTTAATAAASTCATVPATRWGLSTLLQPSSLRREVVVIRILRARFSWRPTPSGTVCSPTQLRKDEHGRKYISVRAQMLAEGAVTEVTIAAYADEAKWRLLDCSDGDWMVVDGWVESNGWSSGSVRLVAEAVFSVFGFMITRPPAQAEAVNNRQRALRAALDEAEAAASSPFADREVLDPLGHLGRMTRLKLALSRARVTVDSAIFNYVHANMRGVQISSLLGLSNSEARIKRAFVELESRKMALRLIAERAFDGDMVSAALLFEQHTDAGLVKVMQGTRSAGSRPN